MTTEELKQKLEEVNNQIIDDFSSQIRGARNDKQRKKLKRKRDSKIISSQASLVKTFIQSQNGFHEVDAEVYSMENGAAHILAKDMKGDMNTNQLRRFFTEIKRMERDLKSKDDDEAIDENTKKELYRLLPELAYARGRGLVNQNFYDIMKDVIPNKLGTTEDFREFTAFLTAIIAYSKLEG